MAARFFLKWIRLTSLLWFGSCALAEKKGPMDRPEGAET